MGGKREPGASVGAAWIHVSEPTQPHIQNDAVVELAICQRWFMDRLALPSLIAGIAYAGQDLT